MLREFLRKHPAEAAQELERIPTDEAAAVLADAPPDEGAPVLAAMGAMAAAEALDLMEVPSAVALVCRLEARVAAMLLRRVTLPSRQNILFVCPDLWKTGISASLAVGPESVGAVMDGRAAVFPADWKVRELLAFMAARPARLAIDVFVEDREHGLVGRLDLRALDPLAASRELRGVMAPDPPRLPLRASIRAVRDDVLWRRFDTIPVVDESGLFAGALPHRALRMAAQREASGDARSPGGAFVEFAELAWTGYVAAVDVASSLTRNLGPTREEGADGQKDQSQDAG
ncbi:MAG: hypothetical protein R2724_32435 [Bryobacterales bacterium]